MFGAQKQIMPELDQPHLLEGATVRRSTARAIDRDQCNPFFRKNDGRAGDRGKEKAPPGETAGPWFSGGEG
jgi:hypothetical protein